MSRGASPTRRHAGVILLSSLSQLLHLDETRVARPDAWYVDSDVITQKGVATWLTEHPSRLLLLLLLLRRHVQLSWCKSEREEDAIAYEYVGGSKARFLAGCSVSWHCHFELHRAKMHNNSTTDKNWTTQTDAHATCRCQPGMTAAHRDTRVR